MTTEEQLQDIISRLVRLETIRPQQEKELEQMENWISNIQADQRGIEGEIADLQYIMRKLRKRLDAVADAFNELHTNLTIALDDEWEDEEEDG